MISKNKNFNSTLLIGITIVSLIVIRIFTMQMIDINPDASNYWQTARLWSLGHQTIHLDHQTTRMAILIPLFILIKVFSYHPLLWYIVPFLFQAIAIYFYWKSISDFFNKQLAYFVVLLLGVYPYLFPNFWHVMPATFSMFYTSIMFYLFFKYLKESKFCYLLGTTFLLFAAYLTKITNLFFFPALVIILFKEKSSFKHIVLFCSILLGLYLLESGFYILLSDYSSRLDVIMNSHLDSSYNPNLETYTNLSGFFDRFKSKNTPFLYQVILLLYPFTFAFFIYKKNKSMVNIGIIVAVFLFFLTFGIKSIDPLVLLSTPRSRYFKIILPWIFVMEIGLVLNIIDKLISYNIIKFFYISSLVFLTIVISFIGLFELEPKKFDHFFSNPISKEYPLKKVVSYYNGINSIKNPGFFSLSGKDERKTIHSIQRVFLNNENFLSITNIETLQLNGKDYLLLSSDSKEVFKYVYVLPRYEDIRFDVSPNNVLE